MSSASPQPSSSARPAPALGWRPAPPQGKGGFTLLELAIAMTFVALLATGIAFSISTALNVWQRTLASADLHQEARAISEVLARDLRGAYLGLDRYGGFFIGQPAEADAAPFDTVELTTGSGDPTRLELLPDERRLATHELGPPASDYIGVRYEWRPESEDGPAGLYRISMAAPTIYTASVLPSGRPSPSPFAWGVTELVSSGITSLRLDYYDGREWRPDWNALRQGNRLPVAVGIAFTLVDERQRTHEFRTVVNVGAP